ncbi:MAG: DUF4190 domain-containing protein [Aeromicrobium sp.]
MTDQPNETPPNPGQVPGAYPPPPPGQYPPPPPGQYPPPPPGQYGYQPVYQAPKHPQATLAMVLGIIGLTGLMCYVTFLVAPFAWWIGAKANREIKADPARYSGGSEASAGKIMGIIGTVFLILGLLAITALIIATVTIDGFWDEDYSSDYSLLGAF